MAKKKCYVAKYSKAAQQLGWPRGARIQPKGCTVGNSVINTTSRGPLYGKNVYKRPPGRRGRNRRGNPIYEPIMPVARMTTRSRARG